MPAIEVKGKTVDEAIFTGLNQLGVSIDEVHIDILSDGTGGFLGMRKAQVRLTPKSEMPKEELEQEEEMRRAAEAAHAEQRRALGLDESRPRRERDRRDRRGRGGRDRRNADTAKSVTIQPEVYVDKEPCAVQPFLEGLLTRMNVQASCRTVECDVENMDRMVVEGPDTAILIGRRGETLDAVQYLCSLVANKGEKEYHKISIDTENYRKKREAALSQLARRVAGRVVRTGKAVTLEPMNPYERRVLHYTLQNNDRVETVSEGEDPYRRVTVRLKKKKTDEE